MKQHAIELQTWSISYGRYGKLHFQQFEIFKEKENLDQPEYKRFLKHKVYFPKHLERNSKRKNLQSQKLYITIQTPFHTYLADSLKETEFAPQSLSKVSKHLCSISATSCISQVNQTNSQSKLMQGSKKHLLSPIPGMTISNQELWTKIMDHQLQMINPDHQKTQDLNAKKYNLMLQEQVRNYPSFAKLRPCQLLSQLINQFRPLLSNQNEPSAGFCRLLRSAPFLREQQGQSLKFKTDNSSTAYNLNSGAAAISLLKLTDRILEVAEDFDLQIIAFHINGKQNTIPYSHSRLAMSVDQSIKEEFFYEVFVILRIIPSNDKFSNGSNRKFMRFLVYRRTNGSNLGLSLNIITIGSTASLLTHPFEVLNSKQTNGREATSVDDPRILVISTAVARAHQDSIKNDNPGRKHRRYSPGIQDEKVKEALTPPPPE
ncbi:MAG: hypothetical protein EZS28_032016, partial [Streblomastix strix]